MRPHLDRVPLLGFPGEDYYRDLAHARAPDIPEGLRIPAGVPGLFIYVWQQNGDEDGCYNVFGPARTFMLAKCKSIRNVDLLTLKCLIQDMIDKGVTNERAG